MLVAPGKDHQKEGWGGWGVCLKKDAVREGRGGCGDDEKVDMISAMAERTLWGFVN